MATLPLTPALRAEYQQLFDTCVIRPERAAHVEGLVNSLVAHRARYEAVGADTGIGWQVIAVIHNMEASQNFARHLHNGDPLTARTVQVPAGRPKTGRPSFTWEASAVDALTMKGLGPATDWSLAGTLYQLERYNGFGYRLYHPHVKSPYLWSFTNHYRSGKYVADGTWSDTAVSKQAGAVALLRRMAERDLFSFVDQPVSATASPKVVSFATTKPTDPRVVTRAIALQQWLSSHDGVFLKLDGYPGIKTSDAYRVVTGHYLPGDPRGA